jgi:alpha-galactosidase
MRVRRRVLIVLVAMALAIGSVLLAAQKKASGGAATVARSSRGLAPSPPMGWNSYDAYCGDVTEQEFKANADYMAKHLAKYGWQYVVVDYYWYFPHPQTEDFQNQEQLEVAMDEYGRLLPAENRFPSAAGGKGFKPLANYVHKLGLKFGIHIMRGIPRVAVKKNLPILGTNARAQDIVNLQNTCSWSTAMHAVDVRKPAGQAYYDSIGKLYAGWGVDYIKADDMTWGENPAGEKYHAPEIEALHKAIVESGRPMVLSLSPGPTPPAQAEHVRKYAELWRISGDFWDNWRLVKRQFELVRPWIPCTGPDRWPDADMLPLGRIRIRGFKDGERRSRLTPDEVRTHMSLWVIFRSPLMIGGDLPTMDAATLAYFTNAEALAVNQHSRNNRELFARGDQVAWAADAPDGQTKYLAVFNIGDSGPTEVAVQWSELGLKGKCAVRDVWEKKNLGAFEDKFTPQLPAHGAGLYKVSQAK